jgi:hypothetical protein
VVEVKLADVVVARKLMLPRDEDETPKVVISETFFFLHLLPKRAAGSQVVIQI